MLPVHVTRGATSMGDDVDDHPWDLRLLNGATLGHLLNRVFRRGYIPMGWVVDWRMWVGGERPGAGNAVALLHNLPNHKRPESIDTSDGVTLRSRLTSLGPLAPDGTLFVRFQFDPGWGERVRSGG